LEIGAAGVPVEIHRGRRHVVVRGDWAGQAAIRKSALPATGIGGGRSRLRSEYLLLASLADSGVRNIPRPLAFDDAGPQPTLILEDAGPHNLAERLQHKPLPVGPFLDLAIQLAEIAESLHARRVVHGDINPSNVVLASDGGRLTLIDFGLASQVAEAEGRATGGELAGTLHYLAPEQTGRLSRPVDPRSDLYALGCTFYEMLTGTPPFPASDPAEIVHAHLAMAPLSPGARNPTLPEPLSAIALRLLAKIPEDRYQTARALAADLREARRQWEAARSIAPFELARLDDEPGLSESGHLFGRQEPLIELLAAAERARAGAGELVLVTGPAGIGKTVLVQSLRASLPEGTIWLEAKFDAARGHLPYGALGSALRQLVRGLLAQPSHLAGPWRTRVMDALGPNAALLAGLIPELTELTGSLPPAATVDGRQSENRFRLTVEALIAALTPSRQVFVLFLDDLQWADPSSLTLLEHLASAPERRHRLILATWRTDADESNGRPPPVLEAARQAGAAVSTLALRPLDLPALTALCAERLRCPPARAQPLAELVLLKTAGNPLFSLRFLRLLQHAGALSYQSDDHSWSWDLPAVAQAAVTENVADLLVNAVARLAPDTRHLLTVAACLRGPAPLDLLAAVARVAPEQAAAQLAVAVREGLLVTDRDDRDEGRRYRFVHDRVAQAAQATLDGEERPRLHLAIGRFLRDSSPARKADELLFDVADQLDRGLSALTDRQERLTLAELNLRAARRARALASSAPALAYARAGIAALPADSRDTHRPLWLALFREAAEGEFFGGDGEAGARDLAQALTLAESTLEKVELHTLRVAVEGARGDWPAVFDWGKRGLQLLGCPLPEVMNQADIPGEVAEVLALLGDRRPADLLQLPRMSDPVGIVTLELMRRMALPARIHDFPVAAFIFTRMIALSLRAGNTPDSAYAYLGLAHLLELDDQRALSERFAHLSVDLLGRLPDPTVESWVLTTYVHWFNHWRTPPRTNVHLLRRAMQAALESGDFQMAGFAVTSLVSICFHGGFDLGRVEAEFAAAERMTRKIDQPSVLPIVRPYGATLRTLQAPSPAPGAPVAGERPATSGFGRVPWGMPDHPMIIVAPFLLGDRAEAARRLSALPDLLKIPGMQLSTGAAWFTFYSALILAATWPDVPPEQRPAQRAAIAEKLQIIRGWSERHPDNFGHRRALVAAELARIEGRNEEARSLYDLAIAGARGQRFLQDEAVAQELAGRFLLAQEDRAAAEAYLRSSRDCFARWGATAKVDLLDREFPGLAGAAGEATGRAITSEDLTTALDLQSLLKATETLSREVVPDRLLEKLIAVCLELAGARRGVLVLFTRNGLEVRASGAISEPVSLQTAALPLSDGVPRPLIEQVFGTGTALALGDAARRGPFTADPYIAARRVRSAVALPILRHGQPTGVLYLENDLTTDAFPPPRVRVLGLLTSAIAIALENSRLFEELRVEIEERSQAERAARFLAEASAILGGTLDYRSSLSQVARLTVSFLADWCVIDVLESEEKLVPVAEAHVDRAREALLRELHQGPARAAGGLLLGREALAARGPVLRHRDGPVAGALAARSTLAVPLLARDRAFGTLQLGSATAGRPYQPADVALVQELARRAALAIDHARLVQEAREAVRLRDEFLAVASHELNTPIASLRLSVSSLLTEAAALPSGTARSLVGIVDRQTARLARLVSDLLDVSQAQIVAHKPELAAVDLTAVVREAGEALAAQLQRAQCPLILELPDSVVGLWDRAALDRTVTNLISNALKFGAGQPITVTVQARTAGGASLVVRDRGIGISAADLPRIFDRFARAVSPDHYGGLGIGLYVVRQMVQQLGGSISVQSTPGQGAAFTVELP
jgi:predicted ATPase/signal transduction histidine kinase